MSNKRVNSGKARWEGVSKEERSEKMRLVVKARWDKMSVKEKSEYAQKMVKAKRDKKGV